MPESVTNWDRSDDHLSKWWDNVTHPTMDDDDAYINLLLHPYWGATYYIRGRERGLSRWQSVGYSALSRPCTSSAPRPCSSGRPIRISSSRRWSARCSASSSSRRSAPHQGQGRPPRQLGQAGAGPHRSPGRRQRSDQSALRRRDPGRPDAVPGPDGSRPTSGPLASALYSGSARPGRGPTAFAREARPGACSSTCAGSRVLPAAVGATVPLSRHEEHTAAMRTVHSWRRWWPAVMAALVLCGLWALTLAAPIG